MSEQLEFITSVPVPRAAMRERADALNAACWRLDSEAARSMVFGLYAPWVDECPGLLTNIQLWGMYPDAQDYMRDAWLSVLDAPEYQDICTHLLELYS